MLRLAQGPSKKNWDEKCKFLCLAYKKPPKDLGPATVYPNSRESLHSMPFTTALTYLS